MCLCVVSACRSLDTGDVEASNKPWAVRYIGRARLEQSQSSYAVGMHALVCCILKMQWRIIVEEDNSYVLFFSMH